ncbi:MAG: dockerin type I domain-containing protein, partial [Pirellula sp.]
SVGGRGYLHDLASATAIAIAVPEVGVVSSEIGVRISSRNTAPVISKPLPLNIDEDSPLQLDFSSLAGSDANGDSIVYLVRSSATFGSVHWNENGTGVYVPNANANGQETFLVQAYDGLDWSTPQSIEIHVNALNDVPTTILSSVSTLSENPSKQAVLASIHVDDPDADSNYEYFVDDSRFNIIDGFLRFVSGTLSFEKEPILLIPVTAVNGANRSDVVKKTITLGVIDANDPPTSIRVPIDLSIPELMPGAEIGSISVVDEDANSNYAFDVKDPRFEVVGGVLRLRNNVALDFEEDSEILVSIVAKDSNSDESIETTVTVSVSDQNDSPSDLFFSCIEQVEEGQEGVTVGYAEVIDFDAGETYTFAINDDRFEIRRGVVSLKPGTSLAYSEPGYIDLMVTATSDRNGEQLAKTSRLYIVRDLTPHHNDDNPYDVDGDGSITPLDPLIIINHINDHGVGPLDSFGEGEGNMPDLDVDGDGAVTPLDILILINKLNQIAFAVGEGESSTDEPGDSSQAPLEPSPDRMMAGDTSVIDRTFAVGYQDDELQPTSTRRLRRR